LMAMAYTLGAAAKATGKSKTAIQKSIASGRLSATKDETGQWQIDPAELHRVYPPKNPQVDDREPHVDAPEIERLKATIEGLERLCRQIEGERDSLRGQNIRLGEQNTRLTALLAPPATKPRKWRLFGKRESA
jgi:hypothetical protein